MSDGLSPVDSIRDVRPSERPADPSAIRTDRAAIEPDGIAAAVERARRDPAAFADLYDVYFPRVYGYVAARMDSAADTEDVVANTFVRALGALHRFEYRGSGSFAAWLFRIAHNQVVSERTRARRPSALEADAAHVSTAPAMDPPPDLAIEQAEDARLLRGLIRSLSIRRQEVVTLRFFGGLRNREIATVLGLDERTVASHLCRALEDLRAKYVNATT